MTMQYTFSKGPRMEERNLDLSLKSPHVFVSFSYSTHVKNAEFYNYFRSCFSIHKVLLRTVLMSEHNSKYSCAILKNSLPVKHMSVRNTLSYV